MKRPRDAYVDAVLEKQHLVLDLMGSGMDESDAQEFTDHFIAILRKDFDKSIKEQE